MTYTHDDAMRDLDQATITSGVSSASYAARLRLRAYIERLEAKAERAGILLSPHSGFDLLDERDALAAEVTRLAAERDEAIASLSERSTDDQDTDDVSEQVKP